jgi:hypothetical protein
MNALPVMGLLLGLLWIWALAGLGDDTGLTGEGRR